MSSHDCPFCSPSADRIFYAGRHTLGLWDGFPVSPGHALLVTKNHTANWFDASEEERAELTAAIEYARREIERDHTPEGFNIGINVGVVAGQTVSHLHVHVIPRYSGDVEDPRGGVRHVIPAKGNYLAAPLSTGLFAADRDPVTVQSPMDTLTRFTTGPDDPLLPQLCAHLDQAISADWAVAFVLQSGVRLLKPHWLDLLDRQGRFRLVTGDYLGATDPDALLQLLDLQQQYPNSVELYAFDTTTKADNAAPSFHTKTYLFRNRDHTSVAWIGSSNLTATALRDGIEWNYRAITHNDPRGLQEIESAFEALLRHPQVQQLDTDWVEGYRNRREPRQAQVSIPVESPPPLPEPHDIQERALLALNASRAEGNTAGLVVLATGLGKTWLSAFDSNRPEYRKVLFVAHREEILNQAMSTFRRIRPHSHLGLYTGTEKIPDADVIFASIQTIGRRVHLERFSAHSFDYIVVDEFHHASANSYRRLLDYFEPRYLLGLTATPERTDGADLLSLCEGNLVFRCDLPEGIEASLLSPFHYYGVPDEVDYANIPWRSSRFDPEALDAAVATQSRASNALDQYRKRAGERTLGFCCSVRHANFMRDFFVSNGLRSAAVHSEDSSDPRAGSLEKLEAGDLDIVFAVDMFNEGVDLPNIDTVMMLRPTESRILWQQQLGRGLRKCEGKSHLTVIDYIGNHRSFLLKPQTLFSLSGGDAEIERTLNLLQQGDLTLPPGCEVQYELEAVDILKGLLRRAADSDVLRFAYEDYRDRHGVRPTATELHRENYRPRSLRTSYGSWLRFVNYMGDLDDIQRGLLDQGRAGDFLSHLETTAMTKSFKMLVLEAMLSADRMPGTISIGELCERVRHLARRSAKYQKDLGVDIDDEELLSGYLEKNPIAAWAGGAGAGGSPFFTYEEGRMSFGSDIAENQRDTYAELVRELVEWRLAEYFDRPGASVVDDTSRFVARVSHSNGRPILFLPNRLRNPTLDIPMGWTKVKANGEMLEANFVKMAVNVMKRMDADENCLPDVLRSWFGDHAGLPGTGFQVEFSWEEGELHVSPLSPPSAGLCPLEVGRSYMREEIAPLFGLKFVPNLWRQGYLSIAGQIFLLVTIEKKGMADKHHYADRFLSADIFEWQSQNRHSRSSKGGQEIQHHEERDVPVHLLVRKRGKLGSKAAPFVYCGEVTFVEWEGDNPITVRWKLKNPLGENLADLLIP